MNKPKLFLLDGMALVYRAFYALNKNPRINSKGLNTSAIVGFVNTILDLLKSEKPEYIGIAFDTQAPTHRKIEFENYKANREAMPEDLSQAIPYIIQFVKAMNIPVLVKEGFEADDIIGTLAKTAEKEQYEVFMVTPDKDFGQLVSENIKIYKPSKFGSPAEILGVKEVSEKFGVENPLQVIDILGIWGDSSDNIPGIPGIGEVGAKKLIQEFGSIEAMIEKADEIKNPKIKEKVLAFADQAILSKKLATIILDVPIDVNIKDLQLQKPNLEAIRTLFNELEFKNLSARFFAEFASEEGNMQKTQKQQVNQQMNLFDVIEDIDVEQVSTENNAVFQTIDNAKVSYQLIDAEDTAAINQLLTDLKSYNNICIDTETTGLDVFTSSLVGVSICFEKHNAYFILFPEEESKIKSLLEPLNTIFSNENNVIVGQNIKFDLAMLQKYGIYCKAKLFDTMIAHYLLQPDQRHNLDYLARTYLDYEPISIESLIGKKGKDQLSMRMINKDLLKDYACEDADVTFQLYLIFKDALKKENLLSVFENIEMPLLTVLLTMENAGVAIDTNALAEYSAQLTEEIKIIENDIYTLAGEKFNIASPKQLGVILFEKLALVEKAKKTKTQQYATGEEVLQKLQGKHPIISKILEHRSLVKLKSTYVDALPLLINPITKKIHTSYNQAVAATGRLSSNNPNLQNIPIRTEKGKEIRKAFIARDKENVIVSADYSQIELRIIASISNDEAMIEAFKQGLDIHASTAARINNVAIENVTPEMRRIAKTVNFGIIYGISAFGLSERIGMPKKQAQQLIDQYFIQFPGIKRYMEETIDKARRLGYVETITGRKRIIRDINSANANIRGYAERNAINAPIQGSAADMIKIAMIEIQKEIDKNKLKTLMIMQVHDELVFDMPLNEKKILFEIVESKMKSALLLKVPLEIEINTGKNWLEAH